MKHLILFSTFFVLLPVAHAETCGEEWARLSEAMKAEMVKMDEIYDGLLSLDPNLGKELADLAEPVDDADKRLDEVAFGPTRDVEKVLELRTFKKEQEKKLHLRLTQYINNNMAMLQTKMRKWRQQGYEFKFSVDDGDFSSFAITKALVREVNGVEQRLTKHFNPYKHPNRLTTLFQSQYLSVLPSPPALGNFYRPNDYVEAQMRPECAKGLWAKTKAKGKKGNIQYLEYLNNNGYLVREERKAQKAFENKARRPERPAAVGVE